MKAGTENQHADGSRLGSWDPIGPWGPDGGRVYSTAVMTLALQIAHRYDSSFAMDRMPGAARVLDVDELEKDTKMEDGRPR